MVLIPPLDITNGLHDVCTHRQAQGDEERESEQARDLRTHGMTQ